MNIRRLFIANRGEIAVRVIQTCRLLGIDTVLAVSDADRSTLGARLAGRCVCVGPARSSESYLKMETMVEAALRTGCDAIHPGYGFLSEHAGFAELCANNGLIFVGPSASQIAAVGDKLNARRHAEQAGVPVVPGGPVASADEARTLADRIGYPVLVKAVAGGGGRGMKTVESATALEQTVELARAEAQAAFGDDRVYLERLVPRGRHVEVQILGDGASVVQLGDRDCSVQRRYQKVVEEAPAPGLPQELRRALHDAAVRFSERLGYRSLGTVEFLVDVDLGQFYFLEMNARIQVEHPATEAITGLDLVAEQLRIAGGEALRYAQDDIRLEGHAVECRINAETVEQDFRPSPGTVWNAWFPSAFDLRVDTHIVPGSAISPHYDSLMAKAIVHRSTRKAALERMSDILGAVSIDGIETNIALHRAILRHPAFVAGGVDTGFLARLLAERKAHGGQLHETAPAR
jgi:acetyl-CoA carboxylase biotin carboxylase subunit